MKLRIIGGGLAGSEAAYYAANQGIKVELFEMRPKKNTPAHKTELLAELVCSNSLGSDNLTAPGLLKSELRLLNSLIIKAAQETKVPAGKALAVDRYKFGEYITEKICSHPNINLNREEVTIIDPQIPTIIATGPLTSDGLSDNLKQFIGKEYLYFFDAISPIVEYESLNHEKIFKSSRYNNDQQDYINCPMNELEYKTFWNELVNADLAPVKDFDKYNPNYFEGCLPVEVLAKRGIDALRFGPMKPVGLIDPKTNKQPYAVVQLRQDNICGTLYNIVGFQTQLQWKEQKRVFSLIPGLENAEFVRFGVMHKNTYINSPIVLNPTLQLKKYPNIFIAGQLTGVEGYVESTAMGMVAAINAVLFLRKEKPVIFPKTTMIGALINYITNSNSNHFQPMNSNWGIIPEIEQKIKNKKIRNETKFKRALDDLKRIISNIS